MTDLSFKTGNIWLVVDYNLTGGMGLEVPADHPLVQTIDLKERNQAIHDLRQRGFSLRVIGKLFGISHSRVDVILNREKRQRR